MIIHIVRIFEYKPLRRQLAIVHLDKNFLVNFACISTLSDYNARLAAMYVQRWFIVS